MTWSVVAMCRFGGPALVGLTLSSLALGGQPANVPLEEHLRCLAAAPRDACGDDRSVLASLPGLAQTSQSNARSRSAPLSLLEQLGGLAKFRYELGKGFAVGSLPYAKDFGQRRNTLAAGAKFKGSEVTFTFKNPGVSWMTDVSKTRVNFRIGYGGPHGDKGQVLLGISRPW
jgi:hypothetical protein